MAYEDILNEIRIRFGITYSPNYLVSIGSAEIPNKIARMAKILRIQNETPKDQCKKCIHCGRLLPKNPLFFSRNNAHKDKLSNTCKECDKVSRIKRGVINGDGDLRKKDPTLYKV